MLDETEIRQTWQPEPDSELDVALRKWKEAETAYDSIAAFYQEQEGKLQQARAHVDTAVENWQSTNWSGVADAQLESVTLAPLLDKQRPLVEQAKYQLALRRDRVASHLQSLKQNANGLRLAKEEYERTVQRLNEGTERLLRAQK